MRVEEGKMKSLLVDPGFVSQEDFNEAVREKKSNGLDIIDFLVDRGVIKDEEWGQVLARHMGCLFVNLRNEKIDKALLSRVPELVARQHRIIVFKEEPETIKAAMADPEDLAAVHCLEKLFQKKLTVYLATENDIKLALSEYRQNLEGALKGLIDNFHKGLNQEDRDKIGIDLVNTIIEYGFYNFASDIHIEPLESGIKIRFRIDGVMHRQAELPKDFLNIIMTRLKIMAKLRIDEHMEAQDGKFRYLIEGEPIDIRLSVLPISNGENAVLRILASGNEQLNLNSIGLSPCQLSRVKELIEHPGGMALVVGPTGSGKTTTLYGIVKELNSEAVHIATIEDPIEYNLKGVSQIQVNKKASLDFASGLRAIVRQDPDIIMVGEIRDQETVGIAINSAMTGHFVLSTLHANNASTAIPRLIDMGIEPYLIVSTVKLIISQRLARRLCERCRYSCRLEPPEIEILRKNQAASEYLRKHFKKDWQEATFYRSQGCKVCANSGYKGRIGIFEIMNITSPVKKAILKRLSSAQLQALAQEEDGMRLMLQDGIDKALNGITSIEEIMRVVGPGK